MLASQPQTAAIAALCLFSNPPSSSRPSFRYWLPDASVDGKIVKEDIGSVAQIGGGGVEFVPFYEYGGIFNQPAPGISWSKYAFGTKYYNELLRLALEAHHEYGLLMDFALGPNQGQGVPSSPDAEGLQWDLYPFFTNLANGSMNNTIPGWGMGELVALVSTSAISSTNVSIPASGMDLTGPDYTSYTKLSIDQSSLQDLTSKVSTTGKLSPEVSLPSSPRTWIFAFYQRRTSYLNVRFPHKATSSIFDNGSYTVDHFSAKGAQHTISFWEKYIMDDTTADLLKKSGQYAWEDSFELISNTNWTPDLPKKFKKQHGYDIRPYLPLIMWQNNNLAIQSNAPGRLRVVMNTNDEGAGYVNDYRATLQSGYEEYLQTLTNWVHKRLGLGLRTQVSYNIPLEMAASVPLVDVPECESLGFMNLDAYRQYTGAAALAGRQIVSNELGAVFGSAYSQTIPSLLDLANTAFSGGVNKFVLHGLSYGGNYSATTWPGHTPFNYVFSDLSSKKQPSWSVGMREAMDYLSRTQYIQQSGVARVDVAIYHHESATNITFPRLYQPKDLENAGYSYRYIAPANLELPSAQVKNNALGPNGPAFKALVLKNGSQVTKESIARLGTLAQQGLPIVIEGEPDFYPSGNGSDKHETLTSFKALRNVRNVCSVKNNEVAQALSRVGIEPFARLKSGTTWIVNHRHDSELLIDYAFVHNPSNKASKGQLTVSHTGFPYFLDPWTGHVEPLLVYERNAKKGTITFSARLGAKQAKTFGFSSLPLEGVSTPARHLTKIPNFVAAVTYNQSNKTVTLKLTNGAQNEKRDEPLLVGLDNGTSQTLKSSTLNVATPTSLLEWDLTVEHWEAPENIYDAATIGRKRNTTHRTTSPLKSWTELDTTIHNASGIGYYSSSFTWPPAGGRSAHGAYLRFGTVLHAVSLSVNGQKTVAVDPFDPIIDIGPYLRRGRNTIIATVPSTMWNYLSSIIDDIKTANASPLTAPSFPNANIPRPGVSLNGILGQVTIEPFVEIQIKLD
ncbi:hypothetical protein BU24DRAFT_439235 [Aaosphaeria arxii CBS 175.79]|uniref:Secreted protein n=1 Tax=Aaosphaeria arxii CBS 175.79 TaxID=1450172 RepID=A0A6A5Y2J2_9PLEO|nr:uncharacterized protein BU24DRAFT_439235 [Aaosphaeria arxii CBS 175.79]KAF2018794.1 hypothetical protein BU24DRAFT_439235 [Aaosphaeria arxii CBS 175.79]